MKKVIGILLAAVIGLAVVAPTNADAQVIYTRKCCDASGAVRCILVNWTPVGDSCFCFGQGYGYAC